MKRKTNCIGKTPIWQIFGSVFCCRYRQKVHNTDKRVSLIRGVRSRRKSLSFWFTSHYHVSAISLCVDLERFSEFGFGKKNVNGKKYMGQLKMSARNPRHHWNAYKYDVIALVISHCAHTMLRHFFIAQINTTRELSAKINRPPELADETSF